MMNFQGKTVVVTGGAKGIGFAITRRFAEAGANMVIADIEEDGANKVESLAKEYEVEGMFVRTDVSDEGEVKKMVEEVLGKFGKIDVFVNNAGIFPSVPALEMDTETWDKIQAINLRGVFLTSREVGKHMKENKHGVFVNIASIDALHPSAVGLGAYDASKHGVWGFTKNFALEMAEYGVRVNAIAPGGVQTEGVEEVTQGQVKAIGEDNTEAAPIDAPMGRFAYPDEMATVAVFLASNAASYMTGEIVVVDGGMLLK